MTLFVTVCGLTNVYATSAKTSLTGALGKRFNAVSEQLTCQCDCMMQLAVCNHQNCPSGIPMRKEIEAKLQEGLSDEAIVAGFVARMGKKALAAPPTEGGYWLVWLLPFAAIALGGLGIAGWLAKVGIRPSRRTAPKLSQGQLRAIEKEQERWKRRYS